MALNKQSAGRTLFLLFILLVALPLLSQQKPQVIPAETSELATLRREVGAKIDRLSARMLEMSDWMYHSPEPGFLEFKAAAMIAEELKKRDSRSKRASRGWIAVSTA